MTNRLSKIATTQIVWGRPAVPGTPAYCDYEPVYRDLGGSSIQLSTAVALTSMAAGRGYSGLSPSAYTPAGSAMFTAINGALSESGAGQVYIVGFKKKCYSAVPGTPAIPSKVNYSGQAGWNSSGLSLGGFYSDGYAGFIIGPSSVGVIAGISTGPDTLNPGDCSHAFYGHLGLLDVYESGALVFSVPGGLAGSPALRIARAGTVVSYLVNGTIVYQSAKPSAGYARIDASMYMAGDYVEDPVIGAYQTGAATGNIVVTAQIDPRPRASGRITISGMAQGRAGSTYFGAASVSLPVNTTVAGYGTNYAAASVSITVSVSAKSAANTSQGRVRAALGIASEGAYAQSSAIYRGGYLGSSVGGYPDIQFSSSSTVATAAYSNGARCLSGGIIAASGVAAACQGAAGETGYAFAVQKFGGHYHSLSYHNTFAPDAFYMGELVVVVGEMSVYSDITATFLSVIEVSGETFIEIELSEGLEWFDAIMAGSTMLEDGDRLADFFDRIAISTQLGIPAREGIQYATNVLTGAVTRYSGYEFMAMHTGQYGSFGVKRDGIYMLGGSDEPIDAAVDFGGTAYGTAQGKRVSHVYFGLTTDGQAMAVLQADKGEQIAYTVSARAPMMRSETSKGLVGNTWRLQLKLYQATKAELDSVEVSVGTVQRRLI